MKNLLFIENTHKREYLYKAKNLGYNIIVAEKDFDNYDNIADYVISVNIHNYDELVTKIVDFNSKIHIDGVLTVHEHAVEAVSISARALDLPGVSIIGAMNSRNKFLTRSLLEKNKITHPKFYLISNLSEINNGVEKIGYPFIIKPLKYSGSSAVIKVNSKEEINGLIDTLKEKREGSSCNATLIDTLPNYWIMEEFLNGFEISVQSITCNNNTQVIAIHDKVVPMNGPEFAEEYILTPSKRIDKTLEEKIVTATKLILEKINFDFGVSHVEFRIVEGKPVLLEVNGRIGGGTTNDIVFHSTGIDLFKALIDISIGKNFSIDIKNRKCVAVKRVQLTPGKILKISGFGDAEKSPGVLLVKQWMNEGEMVKTVTRDVGGAVLASGNTPEEVLDIVENAVDKIHFEIG